MAESTALQAKYKITKSDVVQTNTLSKGQKITQLEGTGTLKMNKISSYMIGKFRSHKFPFPYKNDRHELKNKLLWSAVNPYS